MKNHVINGVMGLCVGDALGVPVEFNTKGSLVLHPVVDMRSYGTYHQPAGTWSDDTSMTLACVDSLLKGLDYHDIMHNFVRWFKDGEFTPFNEVFDIGIATRKALLTFEGGVFPLECGGNREYDNGNGSLMRILLIVFYLRALFGSDFHKNRDTFEIIHNVSALTHAHPRSQIACGIYSTIASMLMDGLKLKDACYLGINQAMNYYRNQEKFTKELVHFKRLENKDFLTFPVDSIKSCGYVVDTLEAAIRCLLITRDYKARVLQAVNLGEDTNSVAAMAGGLAGLYYGYSSIPKEWVSTIIRKEYIENLCNQLNDYLLEVR
jgi:ADP-ribosyl-[dinitrogen reductase] hydrolase